MEPAPPSRSWPLYLILCGIGAVFYLFPVWAVFLVIFSVGGLVLLGLWVWRRILVFRFIRKWGLEGKDLLLVYSNSPHWQEYIETRWLPVLGAHAVVINWSERSRWGELHPLEGEIARTWGGDNEFNPMAILIRRGTATRTVRFWRAFRDFKHGKDAELRRLERELGEMVEVELPKH